jgi:hypothetical protein
MAMAFASGCRKRSEQRCYSDGMALDNRELDACIDRTIAEGQRIIENSDPLRCMCVKAILLLLETARQGDATSIAVARHLAARDRPRPSTAAPEPVMDAPERAAEVLAILAEAGAISE